MDLDDLNQARGTILTRQGKGSKPPVIYLGKLFKKDLEKYLNNRNDNNRFCYTQR
jgi:site-specific recombinase XerD